MEMEDGAQLITELSGYNTKLYHDALTGVYNRRYYEDAVRSMIGPAGVAVMDLDDFKVYNDTYGHHAGDLVLETTTRVIRSCIRPTDTLIRYGGDEFLLLLPVMDGFDVLDYMTRNHTIEDTPVIMISSEDSEDSIRRAYEMGASDYVNRPFDSKVVYRRVYNTIKLYAKQRRLVSMVSDQIRKQEKNTSMLVGVLSQIVEFRNGESGLRSMADHEKMLSQGIL